MKYIFRHKCLSCNNKNLSEIINLGNHSFADRFIPKSKIFLKDPVYPLILDLCKKCNFIQSRVVTNPKNRYVDFNYSYTSGNSNYSKNHWNNFAYKLDEQFNFNNKKIIEIGSNDGFLSDILKKKGANVLAVDASNLMVKICRKKKIKSIQSIFTYSESKKIKKIFGETDFIIANNVFNHSNNPSDFLKGVKNLLKNEGKFIFEQPNFTEGVISLKFDQIYHEHISYFTAKNINSILNYNNFKIMDISNNNYHGGSLRTIAINKDSKEKVSKENKKNLKKFINFEIKKKIYKVKNYREMMNKIDKKKEFLIKKINNGIENGHVFCAIGAGAKSNTFLTYFGLNQTKIKFITDSSKYKQNKLTPLTRIIIKSDSTLRRYKKIYCLILSWNLGTSIKNKIKKINKNIKFIKT